MIVWHFFCMIKVKVKVITSFHDFIWVSDVTHGGGACVVLLQIN